VVVGDGPLLNYSRIVSLQLNIQNKVKFYGWINFQILANEILPTLSLVIHPFMRFLLLSFSLKISLFWSRFEGETFCLANIEAMVR